MDSDDQAVAPAPSSEEINAVRAGIRTSDDLTNFIELLAEQLDSEGGDLGGDLSTLLIRIQALLEDDALFGDTGESRYPETPSWKFFGDIISDALAQE